MERRKNKNGDDRSFYFYSGDVISETYGFPMLLLFYIRKVGICLNCKAFSSLCGI